MAGGTPCALAEEGPGEVAAVHLLEGAHTLDDLLWPEALLRENART
jgi:hypothetical protein